MFNLTYNQIGHFSQVYQSKIYMSFKPQACNQNVPKTFQSTWTFENHEL
jgi:hypothetical protein